MKLDTRKLFRGICRIMRCNPDIMAEAPIQDHLAVVAEAAQLGLVGLISAIAWTVFFHTFISLPLALLFGCIAFAFIVLMDLAIGAADWRLEGILRRPDRRHTWDWWVWLGLRIGISVVLSLATSEGATIALYHNAIAVQLEHDVQTQNRATEDRFARRETELREQRFGTLLKDIEQLSAVLKNTTGPLDNAREIQATARNRLDTAEAEAKRELGGAPGFPAGPGPKYKAALADLAAARAELIKANAQVANYQPRISDATKRLDEAKAKLATAEAGISGDIARLEAEKQSKLVVVRSDPLLNYIALQEVFADPVTGAAAEHFSWLINGVLLILELSYLLVRIGFAHASVYTVLLIKDAKLRAERADAEYHHESDALRRGSGDPPPLLPPVKLISWEDPATKPGNDDKRDHKPSDDDRDAAD